MRYAAFIMTFNRPDVLRQTIERLATQTSPPEKILVVDNGNSLQTLAVVNEFAGMNIDYAGMPENTGPAGASHFGLRTLMEQEFEWVYWGDDDDPPRHADTVERLLSMINGIDRTKIGAVGEVGQRFDWRKGVIARLPDSELAGPVEVDVIAGGQQLILNAEAIHAVGLPNKELFFGYEEPELCLRLRRAGYQLFIDGDRMKAARIEAGRFAVRIRSSSLDRPQENLWRNYYSTRNYIYMMRNSFSRSDLAYREAIKALAKSGIAFLRGWRYGMAFSHMSLLGVIHGFTRKMGKTIEPKVKKPSDCSNNAKRT